MECLLKNVHTAPLTVESPELGVKVTLLRGVEQTVPGDYREHLFTRAGYMTCELLEDENETGGQEWQAESAAQEQSSERESPPEKRKPGPKPKSDRETT
ncbi:hypothetical protein RZE93_003225 [Pluralibacter gergoviae]